MNLKLVRLSLAFTFMATMWGCGGRDMAAVNGTVAFKKKPVTSGVLLFSPIAKSDEQEPGKTATGDIQPNGSFQLSTYKRHDGAIVGRHRVRFLPATDDEDEKVDDASKTVSSFSNLTLPADYEVEIESGKDNEFDIELVLRPR